MGALVRLDYGVSCCQRQNAETPLAVRRQNEVSQFAGTHQVKFIIFLTTKGDLGDIPSVLGENLQFPEPSVPKKSGQLITCLLAMSMVIWAITLQDTTKFFFRPDFKKKKKLRDDLLL